MDPTSQQVGGNDVVISSAPDKPKLFANRKLVLGVIAAVIVVVAGAIIFVITNQRVSDKTAEENAASSTFAGDYVAAFNYYANYILYGEESTSSISGSYNSATVYEVEKMLNSATASSERNEFFEKAQDLIGAFSQAYQNKFGTEEEMDRDVSEYIDAFNYIALYAKIYDLDDALSIYLDNNKNADGAKVAFENMYSSLGDNANADFSEYLGNFIEYNELAIDNYKDYDAAGCIRNKKVDESCVSANVQANEERKGRTDELASAMSNSFITNEFTVVANCWYVRDILESMDE